MGPSPATNRDVFVLGQPLFRLRTVDPEARWQAVINEAEPRDDRRGDGFTPAFRPPRREDGPEQEPTWERLDRTRLIDTLADPPAAWRRVALVCGAGLGKTANLSWMEAALNRHATHRGRQLAYCLELQELTCSADDLMDRLLRSVRNRVGGSWRAGVPLEQDFLRRRTQGRITLLLDSLDQAGPAPQGGVVRALDALLHGAWSACPVWVSGRPHAFRMNPRLFRDFPNDAWEFVRVGQLDEPECRFMLETVRASRARRPAR
jgi:hypothetical protein